MVALSDLLCLRNRKQDAISLKNGNQVHYPPDDEGDDYAGIAVTKEIQADEVAHQEQYRTDTDGERNRASPI